MLDRLYLPLLGLATAAAIALALVWPQGLGDRSPGLVRGPDGGLEILMQRDPPGGAMQNNWLPTPQQRPFSAILRVYLPREPLLVGGYRLPPLETI